MKFWGLAKTHVRGQSLAESLGAILVGTAIISAIGYFLGSAIGYWTISRQHNSSEAVASTLLQELYRDAQSSETPYLPPSDVGGYSNSNGHEIDFYEIDANHAGYFWGYCYKASTSTCASAQAVGTLQRYRFTWKQLPQNGGSGATAQGSADATYSGFAVHQLLTQADYDDTTKNQLAAATYFERHSFSFAQDKTYHWAYPGVTSNTNATYTVTLTLANNETRTIGLAKHHIVFGQTVLYGSATPTPNALCDPSCPGSAAALTFQNPLASSQSTTLVESNYGTRTTTPPQVYTISGCSGNSTFSPSSPVAPSSDGTGSATLTIAPVKQVAPSGLSCTVTATDNVNQSIPISISIGRTYAPSASGGGVVPAGTNANVAVSEENYVGSPQPGFSATTSGPCAIGTGSATMSSDGTYTYSVQYPVTFSKAGVVCYVTFTDTYGQTTNQITTEQQASFSSWPANLVVGSSGWGFGPTSATLADNSPTRLIAQSLNRLLGGSIASAAGTQTCYAYAYASGGAYPNGSADTSLGSTPEITIAGLATIGVASDGCEIFSTDGGVTWTPVGTPNSAVPEPVMVTYEPGGGTGTFQVANSQYTTCTSGMWSMGSWYPNNGRTVTQAALESAGNSAGSCTVAFTDNQSTQTPTVDAGLVNLDVLEGCGAVGGSCTFTIPWPLFSANCDPQMGGNSGWNGANPTVTVSPTGLGNLTSNTDGSYTFLRTAPGTVTVKATEGYTVMSSTGKPPFQFKCTNTTGTVETLTL